MHPNQIVTTKEAKSLSQYGELLTVEDAAKVLSVSKRTIYRLVEKNDLPAVKVGHRLYFPRASMAERLCLGA